MALDVELGMVMARKALTYEQAEGAMRRMLAGEEAPAQVAALLTALRMKGETAEEIAGLAAAMREAATRVATPAGAVVVDTCGTGGDGTNTFNISTVVAFVVAAAGVVVAKHGNRSITSRSGSADVLEQLGVRIDLSPVQMEACLAACGISFLFAPALHPAMKHVGAVRKALGFRTVFNLLGPLANPAGAPYQVIGAPSREVAEKMAGALQRVGTRRSLVVHGLDGLDELTLGGPSVAYEVSEGQMAELELTPGDFGLAEAPMEELRGGDPAENAVIARGILQGEDRGARRDVVLMNAAAALVTCGVAADWREGVARAAAAVDEGRAMGKVEALARLSQSFG
jgi:anthranilate phosphoribosyltransferase